MDPNLIFRVKEGDKRAFSILYDIYADYALRVATAITKSAADAADAVQETFIRVYRNIHSFDDTRPFKPWFYRILVNECNRIMKNKSKVILVDEYLENDSATSIEDNYHFEEYEELYDAIGRLNDINRIPVILKYLDDLTEKEIAQILELNLNTVKSRLYRGREQLKRILEENKRRRASHE